MITKLSGGTLVQVWLAWRVMERMELARWRWRWLRMLRRKNSGALVPKVIKKGFGLAAIVAADPAADLWNFLFVFGDRAKKSSPEQIAREFLGTNDFEICQNRHWYWNFFVARTFRNGRAFLAGDSAHSWPPFGGIGGNTAYGDAINLGWKLALACKGQASELLLDSYTIERRQQVLHTALYVLRVTPNPHLMKLLTSRAFYNRVFMPVIKAGWYHHNSGKHSSNHFAQGGIQFGFKLNFSPVIKREEIIMPDDPTCDYHPTVSAGSRLPHIFLQDGKSIYSLLISSGYTILVVDSELAEIAKVFERKLLDRSIPATAVLLPSLKPVGYEGTFKVVSEILSLERMLVVRPDHVVAWRLESSKATQNQITDGISILTGVGDDGECLKKDYLNSNDASMTKSYQHWLTREFKYAQRPYRFRFPTCVPAHDVTKKTAIDLAKSSKTLLKSDRQFFTSTKQGDENYDDQVVLRESSMDAMPGPSGFESGSTPKAIAIAELLKLAADREARGEPTFNFAVGNPSLNPPVALLEQLAKLTHAASRGQKSGLFKYTHPGGLPDLRKYIAKEIGQWQNLSDLPHENIIITPGAQSGIVNVFEALLQPNDHVLVQCPFYPDIIHAAELWGATAKPIAYQEDFDVDFENLKFLASQSGNKLRLISLCSPANPTGKVLSNDTVKQICDFARAHSVKFCRDVWVLIDCTYRRIAYGGTVPPVFPHYEQSLLLSSFSKDLSLAGERIGYVVVNPSSKHSCSLARWITNNNSKLGNISPPSLIQHAILGLYESKGELPSLTEEYKERVLLIHRYLNNIGMQCKMPDGSFYLFPRLPRGIQSDHEFAQNLAEKGVLVVPGSAFGAPGFVRIAALQPPAETRRACELIHSVTLEMEAYGSSSSDTLVNIRESEHASRETLDLAYHHSGSRRFSLDSYDIIVKDQGGERGDVKNTKTTQHRGLMGQVGGERKLINPSLSNKTQNLSNETDLEKSMTGLEINLRGGDIQNDVGEIKTQELVGQVQGDCNLTTYDSTNNTQHDLMIEVNNLETLTDRDAKALKVVRGEGHRNIMSKINEDVQALDKLFRGIGFGNVKEEDDLDKISDKNAGAMQEDDARNEQEIKESSPYETRSDHMFEDPPEYSSLPHSRKADAFSVPADSQTSRASTGSSSITPASPRIGPTPPPTCTGGDASESPWTPTRPLEEEEAAGAPLPNLRHPPSN